MHFQLNEKKIQIMETTKIRCLRVRQRQLPPTSVALHAANSATSNNSGEQNMCVKTTDTLDEDEFARLQRKIVHALNVATQNFDWEFKMDEDGVANIVDDSPDEEQKLMSMLEEAHSYVHAVLLQDYPKKSNECAGDEGDCGGGGVSVSVGVGNGTLSANDFVRRVSFLPRDTPATEQIAQLSTITPPRAYVSVVKDANPLEALTKILMVPAFDPHAPQLQVQLTLKKAISLTQLSLREDNLIELKIEKDALDNKSDQMNLLNLVCSNILVKHVAEEFYTFCTCKKCLTYREIVFYIMVEQFQVAHMVVLLLDVLIKAYGPMLKNTTAYNNFEKYLDGNKHVYWLASGFIYNKKVEHMDFIFDKTLTDNMIPVLFSAILMVNNPMLLLEILAFHIECLLKAYAKGFVEIVETDDNKVSAELMLTYILDGYEDLVSISEYIASYFFAFEKVFLNKFQLSWTMLCERLYQQHVYVDLADTMLACVMKLKENNSSGKYTELICRYMQFDNKMLIIEKQWSNVWLELHKYSLSDIERKRRLVMMDVYNIFETIVRDSIAFHLPESDDENDFYDFPTLADRSVAWQNVMSYTKMKWPDGFFAPPNVFVRDDKCKQCNTLLLHNLV